MQQYIQPAKGWSTTHNNTYSELKACLSYTHKYSLPAKGRSNTRKHKASDSRNRHICREVVKCALVRDFDGERWSSFLSVPVCVCVCVFDNRGETSILTVTHTYSDMLRDTNTPYWHGHGRMNYLTTTELTVTITTRQTA